MALVEIRDVHKVFQRDSERIEIFTGLTLDIAEGSFTALMGPSGSGKSTLLNLLAGLDKPTSGTIRVAGAEVSAMTPGQLAPWRAQHIGFVFQNLNLLPVLTAFQNVELPLLLTQLSKKERDERVRLALGVVGLARPAAALSRASSPGGQEQRVAIARAIVADPTLVLLDEPTGQLDAKSSQEVLDLLQRLNDEFKKTIIIVTHDAHAAERAKTVLHLEKGVLVERQAVATGMKFFPLVLANLGRHKRRTFLTIASVALALFLFASLRTVVTTLERAGPVRQRAAAGDDQRHRVRPPAAAELRQPARAPPKGITNVTWANWFGGKYGDNKRFFAQFAVDPKSYLDDVSRDRAAGGPEAGLPPGALLGDRRPAAARPVRLEAGPERHHPGHHLPGRLDLHHPRGLHAVRSGHQRRHDALPPRVPGGADRAAGHRRVVHPGDRRRRTTPPPIAQDARRPVPELQRADQDRHRAGVQRQLRHHVGQREPADGHHRHGGGLRDPAGDRQRDDDERPGAHRRSGGAQDHRLHRPARCSGW